MKNRSPMPYVLLILLSAAVIVLSVILLLPDSQATDPTVSEELSFREDRNPAVSWHETSPNAKETIATTPESSGINSNVSWDKDGSNVSTTVGGIRPLIKVRTSS